MEVRHAALTGKSLRDAEDANAAALRRLESRKQQPAKISAPRARKFEHKEITKKELKAASVTRRPAKPQRHVAPACKFCGHCRWCKRFQRTQAIMRKAREGDADMLFLTHELVGLALAAQSKADYRDALGVEYPFSRIAGFTATRAVNAGVESVCDRSVRWLGTWR